MGVVFATRRRDFVNFGLDFSSDVGDCVVVEETLGIFVMPKKNAMRYTSPLNLNKGKRTRADIGAVGELFAEFGNFNSERVLNLTEFVGIPEEEGRRRRREVVRLSGRGYHACYYV